MKNLVLIFQLFNLIKIINNYKKNNTLYEIKKVYLVIISSIYCINSFCITIKYENQLMINCYFR